MVNIFNRISIHSKIHPHVLSFNSSDVYFCFVYFSGIYFCSSKKVGKETANYLIILCIPFHSPYSKAFHKIIVL